MHRRSFFFLSTQYPKYIGTFLPGEREKIVRTFAPSRSRLPPTEDSSCLFYEKFNFSGLDENVDMSYLGLKVLRKIPTYCKVFLCTSSSSDISFKSINTVKAGVSILYF